MELEIIRSGGPEYQALIARAVAETEVYESVHEGVKSLFNEGSEEACERAIEVATHLGDRAFARYLAEYLLGTAISDLEETGWLNQAVTFLSEALVPTHPLWSPLFELAITMQSTRLQAWRMSRQGDASAVLPWVPELLRRYPDEVQAIGIKFALVWQDSVLALAEVLATSAGLPEQELQTLLQTLETYLLRVRRVRLWREFVLIFRTRTMH
ncbi:MAG: hypothetical protein ACPGQS_01305 [Bradymonadia bacterium]